MEELGREAVGHGLALEQRAHPWQVRVEEQHRLEGGGAVEHAGRTRRERAAADEDIALSPGAQRRP